MRGDWVRWSQHLLVNGVLVPDPKAGRVRYDPWAGFRANVGKYRTASQPYLELLELYRALQDDEARGVKPTAPQARGVRGPSVGSPTAADHRIRDWCNRQGHLGIVPVMSTLVQLSDVADRDQLAIQRTHYVRDGDRWHRETASQADWVSTREATDQRLRERVTESHGTITWFNFGSRIYDELPLETLQDYFPLPDAAGDPFVPPLPLTDQFWRSYGEPVWEINRYCRLFGRAVEYLAQWNHNLPTDEQDPTVKRASMFLKDLAHNVALDEVENTRTSAGLLASYALMVLWDRADGRRCLHCEKCDGFFTSNDKRALYCSPRCRNRVQSERHRAKKAGTKGSEGAP